MATCISRKRVYPSQEVAEDALIEAWTKFDYTPDNGPVAIYRCEDCGYYHFTSRGPMNARLSAQLGSGKIQREKEANRWLGKLKNR